MKRNTMFAAAKAALVGVIMCGMATACQNGDSPVGGLLQDEAKNSTVAQTKNDAQTASADEIRLLNQQLESIAVAVGAFAKEPANAAWLHKKCVGKFDGETNVLWQDLANDNNKSLIASILQSSRGKASFSSRASLDATITRLSDLLGGSLHLYWYRADRWDGKTTPLIAFTPLSEKGNRKNEVFAVDENGNAQAVSENTAKQRPIIVITRNERTEKDGRLRAQNQNTVQSIGKNTTQTQSSTFRIDYVRIGDIGYWDEWWFDGGPEFKGFVIGQNVQTNTNEFVIGSPLWLIIPLENCNNVTYSLPNPPQMYWDSNKYPNIMIRWVEEDGGWAVSEAVSLPWGGNYTINTYLYGTDDFTGNLLKTHYFPSMPANSGMYREASNGLMMTAATW